MTSISTQFFSPSFFVPHIAFKYHKQIWCFLFTISENKVLRNSWEHGITESSQEKSWGASVVNGASWVILGDSEFLVSRLISPFGFVHNAAETAPAANAAYAVGASLVSSGSSLFLTLPWRNNHSLIWVSIYSIDSIAREKFIMYNSY